MKSNIHNGLRNGLIGALLISSAALVSGQAVPDAAAPNQRAEKSGEAISSLRDGKNPDTEGITQEARTAEFIRLTQKAQGLQEGALSRSVGDTELRGVQGLVKAVALNLPQPVFVKNPQQLTTIQELFVRDVALRLSSLGFKAGDIRARQGGGADLVNAAAAAVRGSATPAQLLLLSDTAFDGRVISTDLTDNRGDGFNSSMVVEVVQPIKGVKAGDRITIRQFSGDVNGRAIRRSSDYLGKPGSSVRVVASRALYNDGRSAASNDIALPIVPISSSSSNASIES